MPLSAGERLGHYEILGQLGRGGMGTVYRARDTRLGREVAVKVSSERFNERFEREARVVASLNHPNICTLFDVGPNYLVMELIEGESPKGPLPVDTVLDYARQMADALDYAHEHGVTHRDLKPGNLKVTPDGKLKVLDFGLAKTGPASKVASAEDSPTLTVGMTEVGVILGTAAYMAPEQAKGKPVDKRADIWSFGVVLYELATGKRLFKGEDISDILASVLKEAPDFTAVPERLRPLLKRCLEKDPKKRLRDIADAMSLVVESSPRPAPARRTSWAWPAIAAALVIGLGLGVWSPWAQAPPVPLAPVTQFEVELPPGATGLNVVSPDGRKIAFAAPNSSGALRLFVHDLDSLETRELTQAESSGRVPFWSFDSRWLVYHAADRTVKRIDIRGGPPQTVCTDAPTTGGGAWNAEGDVLVSIAGTLRRVTDSGCPPLAGLRGIFPAFLPGGRRFTYVVLPGRVVLGSLGAVEGETVPKPFASIGSLTDFNIPNTGYVPPVGPGHGHVLYIQGGNLLAYPLDEASGRLTGETAVLFGNVSLFSASATLLAYRRSGIAGPTSRLTWVDRAGKRLKTVGDPDSYTAISLSPNAEWATVLIRNDPGSIRNNVGPTDLHRVDLSNGRKLKLTTNQPVSLPVWSDDSREIVYSGAGPEGTTIYRRSAFGSGEAEVVIKLLGTVTSWSSDKRYLLVTVQREKTGTDIDLVSLEGSEAKAMPLLQMQDNESNARFSPDGHWIAYISNESGRPEIYVRSFTPGASDGAPSIGAPLRVSKGMLSNTGLFWGSDSRALAYLNAAGEVAEVSMIDNVQGRFGAPVMVRPGTAGAPIGTFTPDLQGGIVAIEEASPETSANTPQKLVVIENWQSLPQVAR